MKTKHLDRNWTLLKRHGSKCFYCNVKLTPESATKDHVIPKSKGGTNDLCNLVVACEWCNTRKADRDINHLLKKMRNCLDANLKLQSSKRKYMPVSFGQLQSEIDRLKNGIRKCTELLHPP